MALTDLDSTPNAESNWSLATGRHLDRDEATDALFDTSNGALAARFGARVCELMRQRRDVRQAARLAFSYAFLVRPDLREGE